ncbi:hypothetical protein, partial [Variovorax sp. OV084]|uniref:hypothetical protein n=1 Tax=Variovorax sp. OV084 TaxID=1882777 RepID=UPI001C42E773
ARSRTSGENLFDFFMAQSSQSVEPPQKPGRFRSDRPLQAEGYRMTADLKLMSLWPRELRTPAFRRPRAAHAGRLLPAVDADQRSVLPQCGAVLDTTLIRRLQQTDAIHGGRNQRHESAKAECDLETEWDEMLADHDFLSFELSGQAVGGPLDRMSAIKT